MAYVLKLKTIQVHTFLYENGQSYKDWPSPVHVQPNHLPMSEM